MRILMQNVLDCMPQIIATVIGLINISRRQFLATLPMLSNTVSTWQAMKGRSRAPFPIAACLT